MAIWQVSLGIAVGIIATILTMVLNRPRRQIKSNYVEPSDEICPICLETMSNREMLYLLCGHALHESCLSRLREHGDSLCPKCRVPFR